MAVMTLLQHRFKILWSVLEPMQLAAATPASLDSGNIIMGAEEVSKMVGGSCKALFACITTVLLGQNSSRVKVLKRRFATCNRWKRPWR